MKTTVKTKPRMAVRREKVSRFAFVGGVISGGSSRPFTLSVPATEDLITHEKLTYRRQGSFAFCTLYCVEDKGQRLHSCCSKGYTAIAIPPFVCLCCLLSWRK